MNIYQEERKIGYAHRQFFKTLEGYKFLESVFMQINTMGMVQDIRFKTEGNLHHNLSLSSFNFQLLSNLFRFKARGVLKDKILTLFIGSAIGSEEKIDLPLRKEIHLSAGILELLSAEDLKPGAQSRIVLAKFCLGRTAAQISRYMNSISLQRLRRLFQGVSPGGK